MDASTCPLLLEAELDALAEELLLSDLLLLLLAFPLPCELDTAEELTLGLASLLEALLVESALDALAAATTTDEFDTTAWDEADELLLDGFSLALAIFVPFPLLLLFTSCCASLDAEAEEEAACEEELWLGLAVVELEIEGFDALLLGDELTGDDGLALLALTGLDTGADSLWLGASTDALTGLLWLTSLSLSLGADALS